MNITVTLKRPYDKYYSFKEETECHRITSGDTKNAVRQSFKGTSWNIIDTLNFRNNFNTDEC